MTPAVKYRSSTFLCKATGQPRIRYLLPESSPIQFAAYAFEQELSVNIAGFPPQPRNTPSTNATFGLASYTPNSATQSTANAILTSVSPAKPVGADLVAFTGAFAIVPASWDDFQTQVVNFPGWLNSVGNNFRDPKPTEVNVRLHYDYFVIDPTAVAAGVKDSSGTAISTVTAKGAIPILRRTPWLATLGGTALLNDEAKALTPAAGIGGYQPTLPTIEQYQAWCGIATAFLIGSVAWDATHPPVWDGTSTTDVLSGQFRLSNSKLIDYAGNIISRVTAYAMVE